MTVIFQFSMYSGISPATEIVYIVLQHARRAFSYN
jgi:hypothetical protein